MLTSPLNASRKYSRATRAFSLIELLVIVLLILVLAALISPALQQMRKSSWITKSLHNARQLAAGGLRYAAEHRGHFPRTGFSSWPDPAGYERWASDVAPYVYSSAPIHPSGDVMVDGVFRSPGLEGYRRRGDSWARLDWSEVDWINFWGVYAPGTTTPMRISALIHEPSRTPWLVSTDRNDGGSGLIEGNQSLFDTYVPPSVWKYNGGVIVAYIDGHAELIVAPNLSNIFKKTETP